MTPARTAETRTQRERSEATTGALVTAAREMFALDGFAATSLDDIAAAAGVTKGALYHHFAGKQEIFRAVFEEEQRRLTADIVAAYDRERDPWKGFFAGCRAFLNATLDEGVQRIQLLDAPAVLGWEAIREIQERYSLALMKRGLELAMDAGLITPRPVEPLAHMLVGAICESAMMTARAPDKNATAKRVLAELRTMLDALRA